MTTKTVRRTADPKLEANLQIEDVSHGDLNVKRIIDSRLPGEITYAGLTNQFGGAVRLVSSFQSLSITVPLHEKPLKMYQLLFAPLILLPTLQSLVQNITTSSSSFDRSRQNAMMMFLPVKYQNLTKLIQATAEMWVGRPLTNSDEVVLALLDMSATTAMYHITTAHQAPGLGAYAMLYKAMLDVHSPEGLKRAMNTVLGALSSITPTGFQAGGPLPHGYQPNSAGSPVANPAGSVFNSPFGQFFTGGGVGYMNNSVNNPPFQHDPGRSGLNKP